MFDPEIDELTPEFWMRDAECGSVEDPDLFFSNRMEDIKVATDTCRLCIVRFQCAEYALNNNIEEGVWGGLSENDRAMIRKQKRNQSRKGIPNKQH
jgi:WhiB family redox-sensing transcriptional regulator